MCQIAYRFSNFSAGDTPDPAYCCDPRQGPRVKSLPWGAQNLTLRHCSCCYRNFRWRQVHLPDWLVIESEHTWAPLLYTQPVMTCIWYTLAMAYAPNLRSATLTTSVALARYNMAQASAEVTNSVAAYNRV